MELNLTACMLFTTHFTYLSSYYTHVLIIILLSLFLLGNECLNFLYKKVFLETKLIL